MKQYFLVFLIAVTLAACSSTGEQEQIFEAERPAADLYAEAEAALQAGEYLEAGRLFDEVERQHPYSDFARQAQLNSAVSAYRDLRYDEAIIALDRFIDLYPGSDDVPYALYLKAVSFYEQISDVRRDQDMTRLALDAFNTLIRRFPDSAWARDAELKRDLTEDHLAGKEMEIGRYYLTRGHINAAINRFTNVVRRYDTTTPVPEALHRLVESYMTLGLEAQALRVAAVLGHNYPGSSWYERSFQLLDQEQRARILDERNWIDRTVDSLLNPA